MTTLTNLKIIGIKLIYIYRNNVYVKKNVKITFI